MKRFFLLVCLCGILTNHSIAAAADITISSAHTPETTPATIGSAANIGTVSTSGFSTGSIVVFSVQEGNKWVINASTGLLSRKANFAINYEAPTTSLTATVTAEDPFSLTTVTKAFIITIDDLNEPPSNLAISSFMCQEESFGATIGTLTRVDDANDTATYSVLVSSGYRIIAPNTLALAADKKVDFETTSTQGSYVSRSVTVTVTDSGGLTTTLDVIVNPTDVNEAPTGLTISGTSCAEETAGETIGTLNSNEVDNSDTASYSVPVNSGYRIIFSNTLALDTTKKLDLEDSSVRGGYASRSVTVTVTDSGGLSATLNVTVTPTNVNDAPTGLVISGTSCAEESLGATIGTLTPLDVDTNDTAAYTVPNNSGYRIIFPNTLALDADRKLDFENSTARGNYASRLVTVTVTDSGGLTATLNVTVTPTNLNEAPTSMAISGSSCLEESLGASIGTLIANELDLNDTATFSVPSNSGYRIIFPNTLALAIDKKLDRENSSVRGNYPSRSVLVTVTDAGGLTASLNVNVDPTNVNESPTVIEIADGGSVNENDAGARIAGLRNNDPDVGDTITYSLVDPAGPLIIAGSELRLKTGTSLNFEAGASIPVSIIATDTLGLSCTSSVNITVIDQNDTPTLPTWAIISLAVIDASASLPLASAADVLNDEDLPTSAVSFRDYRGVRLKVSFTSEFDDRFDIAVSSELRSLYFLSSDTVVLKGGTTTVANIQKSNKEITFTIDSDRASSLTELSHLLRLVSFKPDTSNLNSRTSLSVTLDILNQNAGSGSTSQRTITLDTANVPPSITSGVTIPVTRFSQVSITPAMLGIADEHQELGLTLFVDYPTLNGKLYTSTQTLPLGPDTTVPVVYTASTVTPNTGSLSLDLIYVPDTGNSASADACFFSVLDHGSKLNVTSTSYLRTIPTKVSFAIQAGAVPVVTNPGAPTFLEGADPITLVQPSATLELSGTTDPANANLGGWNLYVSYAAGNRSTGPGNATETLAVRPQGLIMVDADGRTVKLNGRAIAQIDASAKGSESALLLILNTDIVGSEVLTLAKALIYRDSSPRLPLIASDPKTIRKLFLGFVQKNDGTTFAGVQVSVTRTGIDSLPVFTDGSRRTVITVSDESILGSSVLEDIDTNEVPNISIKSVTGNQIAVRATVTVQRGPEDTTKTYRTTIGWKLQRDREVTGDQDFILSATIGNTTLSQTITLSPRSGSDLALAIASDAPLALIKPTGAAEPIKRALRVRRGAASVDDASFFLLGTTIPPWITIDSTAGTMTYDLSDKGAVAGATYRFSVLATAGTTAAEQPVVLRVVAQPVLSGTN